MHTDSKARSSVDGLYPERKMIMVVDDAVAAAMRQAEVDAQEYDKADRWQKIVKDANKILFGLFDGGLGALFAGEIIDAWRRLREDGIQLLQIAKSEAAALEFPPGHPMEKVIYVAHPVTPTVYFTAAQFHRVTFEHKFSEAIDLLMHLGATNIRVEHLRGWSRDFAASMSAPLSQVGAEIGIEAGAKRQSTSRLLFEATLAGETEPKLPQSLVWYHHEPTWQSVANGRLKFGLRNFSLNVSYEDDFGVNAGLKIKATKAGLELGGTFEDHQATSWNIHGQFGGS